MASEIQKFGIIEQSAIREIANIGLGHATTALSSMTGRPFNMSVPDAEQMTLEEIPLKLGGGEALAVGIYMPFVGDTNGHIAFLLPFESAQSLWTMLLGMKPETPAEMDDLYNSAIIEVGNIINSSFLSAISDMTNLRMESTPPMICADMSVAVLNAVICQAAHVDSEALAIRTSIHDEESSVEGFFVFIPTVGGLRKVFNALGIEEAA